MKYWVIWSDDGDDIYKEEFKTLMQAQKFQKSCEWKSFLIQGEILNEVY